MITLFIEQINPCKAAEEGETYDQAGIKSNLEADRKRSPYVKTEQNEEKIRVDAVGVDFIEEMTKHKFTISYSETVKIGLAAPSILTLMARQSTSKDNDGREEVMM